MDNKLAVNSLMEEDVEYQALTDKHKLFIANVLAGKTYTQSYADVYPDANRKTAGTKGCTLYNKYKNLIERHKPVNKELLQVIANETVASLKQIAFADIGLVVDPHSGKPLPLHRIPREVRMGITEIEVRGDRYSYSMGGKIKAMELLAKICRLEEPAQTTVNISISSEEREAKIKEILVRASSRPDDKDEE